MRTKFNTQGITIYVYPNLGRLVLTLRPRYSDKLSAKWVDNNLSYKALKKHLIAARKALGLSMADVQYFVSCFKTKRYSGTMFGRPGQVQVYIRG